PTRRSSDLVDHASDVAVERDVVQVVLVGTALLLVLLRNVAHAGEALLAEQRVVLDVDLRVERDEVPVAGDDQRVDLDEARVALDEELHELRQELMQLLLLVWIEPEPEADPPGL